jgi:exodeoxyribonuclease VII large subunit
MNMSTEELVLSVSDFVALLNQTLEYAYPSVVVSGELANFRVSKGKWVYFDLKDEFSSVRCFGTVYQLPGPLEDGMMLHVRAMPHLHQLYGFSLNIMYIQPVGEGAIRRAAELLQAKLAAEGLFDESRKRLIPYPPQHIGLIASGESAAYVDFIKILNARWGDIEIVHIDVQVQGEPAIAQIVSAVEQLNGLAEPPEVIVITRGGGSAEDLQAFSSEQVTRTVAASRVPTLVAIGHEVDISLAELAADQRASTPSNAAELLVPDKRQVLEQLASSQIRFVQAMQHILMTIKGDLVTYRRDLLQSLERTLQRTAQLVTTQRQLLAALSPEGALQRGYVIVRRAGKIITNAHALHPQDGLTLHYHDGTVDVTVSK